jgi:ABC-type polysaccharide/polyol phosphate export permease
MWFAFTYGLKINTIDGSTPFSLWLIVGIIAWFYASEIIISTSGCIKEYSYLIKNVNFKASIIPIIKIISSSVIHLFFIGFIFIVCLVYDKEPSLIWFQVIYYLFCILFLTTGIAWLTSSLYVFVKDISQVVNVIMQFFFWLTPIIWSVEIVPPYLLKYMKLNPFLYIVEGYRNTFIYEKWFFQDLNYLIYFWSLSILLFFIGAVTFHRLKPHFADVL